MLYFFKLFLAQRGNVSSKPALFWVEWNGGNQISQFFFDEIQYYYDTTLQSQEKKLILQCSKYKTISSPTSRYWESFTGICL